MDLSQSDYKKIIDYYQIKKQKNKTYKETAEDILANKLCRCIKKITPYNNNNEKDAIAICRNTIFKKRGIDFSNFKCKTGNKLVSKKGTRKKLDKFSKQIGFNKSHKNK
jgi:hypothetical protein